MAPASSRSVMKLLKRLTTIANFMPRASRWPAKLFPVLFSILPPVLFLRPLDLLAPPGTGSTAGELCRALFQKSFRSFAHVFGGAAQPEERCSQEAACYLRHLHAVVNCLHSEFYRERGVGGDFLRQGFGGGHELRQG